MKLIIAGGRDYRFTAADNRRLDEIQGVTEVVSGCQTGADFWGEVWAKDRGIPIQPFPANWNAYGLDAGPIRNEAMAAYADAVVLFPGGRGTNNMLKKAKRAGLKIYDWRNGSASQSEIA